MEEHEQNNFDISQNITSDPELNSKTEYHQAGRVCEYFHRVFANKLRRFGN